MVESLGTETLLSFAPWGDSSLVMSATLSSSIALFLSVTCLWWRLSRKKGTSETSLVTGDWAQTSRIYELLPRWRLHLSVIARWLKGTLTGKVDPTTGLPRSYWSYKADAYEQMAPKITLAHIARWFDVVAWKRNLTMKVDDVVSHAGEKRGGELREHIQSLTSGQACSSSNSVRLPIDGVQAFEWRRRLLQGAKRRVLFMTAYISVDEDARAIASDLADCARRGVETYVALDNFGADVFEFCGVDTRYQGKDQESFEYADLIHTLVDAGCKLCFWRAADCVSAKGTTPGASHRYELLDCKNHIKELIVDGEVAILTDRNVGSCYFRNPAYSSIEVALAGPCVKELEAQFAALWTAGGGVHPLAPSSPCLNPISHASEASSSKLFASLCDSPEDDKNRLFPDVWGAVMVSTPRILESGIDPILLTLMVAIRNAKHSVDLMFAYMEICKPLRDELLAAIGRGVSVRVVTNSRETNDLFWINAAFLQSVLPVVEAGGKLVMAVIAPEDKGHVHAKVAVIDRRFLLVGSWNAWLRSTLYEVEADILLDSPPLASRTAEKIDSLEASEAYRVFDKAAIEEEFAADPLGVDPSVVGFL